MPVVILASYLENRKTAGKALSPEDVRTSQRGFLLLCGDREVFFFCKNWIDSDPDSILMSMSSETALGMR